MYNFRNKKHVRLARSWKWQNISSWSSSSHTTKADKISCITQEGWSSPTSGHTPFHSATSGNCEGHGHMPVDTVNYRVSRSDSVETFRQQRVLEFVNMACVDTCKLTDNISTEELPSNHPKTFPDKIGSTSTKTTFKTLESHESKTRRNACFLRGEDNKGLKTEKNTVSQFCVPGVLNSINQNKEFRGENEGQNSRTSYAVTGSKSAQRYEPRLVVGNSPTNLTPISQHATGRVPPYRDTKIKQCDQICLGSKQGELMDQHSSDRHNRKKPLYEPSCSSTSTDVTGYIISTGLDYTSESSAASTPKTTTADVATLHKQIVRRNSSFTPKSSPLSNMWDSSFSHRPTKFDQTFVTLPRQGTLLFQPSSVQTNKLKKPSVTITPASGSWKSNMKYKKTPNTVTLERKLLKTGLSPTNYSETSSVSPTTSSTVDGSASLSQLDNPSPSLTYVVDTASSLGDDVTYSITSSGQLNTSPALTKNSCSETTPISCSPSQSSRETLLNQSGHNHLSSTETTSTLVTHAACRPAADKRSILTCEVKACTGSALAASGSRDAAAPKSSSDTTSTTKTSTETTSTQTSSLELSSEPMQACLKSALSPTQRKAIKQQTGDCDNTLLVQNINQRPLKSVAFETDTGSFKLSTGSESSTSKEATFSTYSNDLKKSLKCSETDTNPLGQSTASITQWQLPGPGPKHELFKCCSDSELSDTKIRHSSRTAQHRRKQKNIAIGSVKQLSEQHLKGNMFDLSSTSASWDSVPTGINLSQVYKTVTPSSIPNVQPASPKKSRIPAVSDLSRPTNSASGFQKCNEVGEKTNPETKISNGPDSTLLDACAKGRSEEPTGQRIPGFIGDSTSTAANQVQGSVQSGEGGKQSSTDRKQTRGPHDIEIVLGDDVTVQEFMKCFMDGLDLQLNNSSLSTFNNKTCNALTHMSGMGKNKKGCKPKKNSPAPKQSTAPKNSGQTKKMPRFCHNRSRNHSPEKVPETEQISDRHKIETTEQESKKDPYLNEFIGDTVNIGSHKQKDSSYGTKQDAVFDDVETVVDNLVSDILKGKLLTSSDKKVNHVKNTENTIKFKQSKHRLATSPSKPAKKDLKRLSEKKKRSLRKTKSSESVVDLEQAWWERSAATKSKLDTSPTKKVRGTIKSLGRKKRQSLSSGPVDLNTFIQKREHGNKVKGTPETVSSLRWVAKDVSGSPKRRVKKTKQHDHERTTRNKPNIDTIDFGIDKNVILTDNITTKPHLRETESSTDMTLTHSPRRSYKNNGFTETAPSSWSYRRPSLSPRRSSPLLNLYQFIRNRQATPRLTRREIRKVLTKKRDCYDNRNKSLSRRNTLSGKAENTMQKLEARNEEDDAKQTLGSKSKARDAHRSLKARDEARKEEQKQRTSDKRHNHEPWSQILVGQHPPVSESVGARRADSISTGHGGREGRRQTDREERRQADREATRQGNWSDERHISMCHGGIVVSLLRNQGTALDKHAYVSAQGSNEAISTSVEYSYTCCTEQKEDSRDCQTCNKVCKTRAMNVKRESVSTQGRPVDRCEEKMVSVQMPRPIREEYLSALRHQDTVRYKNVYKHHSCNDCSERAPFPRALVERNSEGSLIMEEQSFLTDMHKKAALHQCFLTTHKHPSTDKYDQASWVIPDSDQERTRNHDENSHQPTRLEQGTECDHVTTSTSTGTFDSVRKLCCATERNDTVTETLSTDVTDATSPECGETSTEHLCQSCDKLTVHLENNTALPHSMLSRRRSHPGLPVFDTVISTSGCAEKNRRQQENFSRVSIQDDQSLKFRDAYNGETRETCTGTPRPGESRPCQTGCAERECIGNSAHGVYTRSKGMATPRTPQPAVIPNTRVNQLPLRPVRRCDAPVTYRDPRPVPKPRCLVAGAKNRDTQGEETKRFTDPIRDDCRPKGTVGGADVTLKDQAQETPCNEKIERSHVEKLKTLNKPEPMLRRNAPKSSAVESTQKASPPCKTQENSGDIDKIMMILLAGGAHPQCEKSSSPRRTPLSASTKCKSISEDDDSLNKSLTSHWGSVPHMDLQNVIERTVKENIDMYMQRVMTEQTSGAAKQATNSHTSPLTRLLLALSPPTTSSDNGNTAKTQSPRLKSAFTKRTHEPISTVDVLRDLKLNVAKSPSHRIQSTQSVRPQGLDLGTTGTFQGIIEDLSDQNEKPDDKRPTCLPLSIKTRDTVASGVYTNLVNRRPCVDPQLNGQIFVSEKHTGLINRQHCVDSICGGQIPMPNMYTSLPDRPPSVDSTHSGKIPLPLAHVADSGDVLDKLSPAMTFVGPCSFYASQVEAFLVPRPTGGHSVLLLMSQGKGRPDTRVLVDPPGTSTDPPHVLSENGYIHVMFGEEREGGRPDSIAQTQTESPAHAHRDVQTEKTCPDTITNCDQDTKDVATGAPTARDSRGTASWWDKPTERCISTTQTREIQEEVVVPRPQRREDHEESRRIHEEIIYNNNLLEMCTSLILGEMYNWRRSEEKPKLEKRGQARERRRHVTRSSEHVAEPRRSMFNSLLEERRLKLNSTAGPNEKRSKVASVANQKPPEPVPVDETPILGIDVEDACSTSDSVAESKAGQPANTVYSSTSSVESESSNTATLMEKTQCDVSTSGEDSAESDVESASSSTTPEVTNVDRTPTTHDRASPSPCLSTKSTQTLKSGRCQQKQTFETSSDEAQGVTSGHTKQQSRPWCKLQARPPAYPPTPRPQPNENITKSDIPSDDRVAHSSYNNSTLPGHERQERVEPPVSLNNTVDVHPATQTRTFHQDGQSPPSTESEDTETNNSSKDRDLDSLVGLSPTWRQNAGSVASFSRRPPYSGVSVSPRVANRPVDSYINLSSQQEKVKYRYVAKTFTEEDAFVQKTRKMRRGDEEPESSTRRQTQLLEQHSGSNSESRASSPVKVETRLPIRTAGWQSPIRHSQLPSSGAGQAKFGKTIRFAPSPPETENDEAVSLGSNASCLDHQEHPDPPGQKSRQEQAYVPFSQRSFHEFLEKRSFNPRGKNSTRSRPRHVPTTPTLQPLWLQQQQQYHPQRQQSGKASPTQRKLQLQQQREQYVPREKLQQYVPKEKQQQQYLHREKQQQQYVSRAEEQLQHYVPKETKQEQYVTREKHSDQLFVPRVKQQQGQQYVPRENEQQREQQYLSREKEQQQYVPRGKQQEYVSRVKEQQQQQKQYVDRKEQHQQKEHEEEEEEEERQHQQQQEQQQEQKQEQQQPQQQKQQYVPRDIRNQQPPTTQRPLLTTPSQPNHHMPSHMFPPAHHQMLQHQQLTQQQFYHQRQQRYSHPQQRPHQPAVSIIPSKFHQLRQMAPASIASPGRVLIRSRFAQSPGRKRHRVRFSDLVTEFGENFSNSERSPHCPAAAVDKMAPVCPDSSTRVKDTGHVDVGQGDIGREGKSRYQDRYVDIGRKGSGRVSENQDQTRRLQVSEGEGQYARREDPAFAVGWVTDTERSVFPVSQVLSRSHGSPDQSVEEDNLARPSNKAVASEAPSRPRIKQKGLIRNQLRNVEKLDSGYSTPTTPVGASCGTSSDSSLSTWDKAIQRKLNKRLKHFV